MKYLLIVFFLFSCKSFLSSSLNGKNGFNATPPIVVASSTTTTTRANNDCYPTDRHVGDAQAGQAHYFDNSCISCHGADGSGALYGSIIGVSDEDIYEAIKINPPREMEDLQHLDPCVIQDIAAHIDSF